MVWRGGRGGGGGSGGQRVLFLFYIGLYDGTVRLAGNTNEEGHALFGSCVSRPLFFSFCTGRPGPPGAKNKHKR
jgi:hypothetical protein